ncbi:efflux RND transporter periplasmic adaptor subunit [Bernardetia sp.]|uniref:efflux RND transporter periplasmic adaptor subunit n=1 Tax=Bernardetia sp. TaxID=1937974 RepID=UPI0025BEDBCB|nr:efflux RND transporter periplasmic adaptor subunit [Bernardetia sp.]
MKKQIIIYILLLLVGGVIGYFIHSSSSSNEETSDKKASSENQIWTCSMHPQIRQPEAGDCPICGMDLIPLKNEDEQGNPMAVRMSPTAIQLADIQTAKVGNSEAIKTISLNGKIQPDERKIFTQSTHIEGRVEKLNVNFTGEYIRKGTPIAYIYSPKLLTAQQELFEAQKIKDTQPQLFQAAKEKLKTWKLTESQINQLLESGKTIEEFPILADVSGYVIEKMVNLGDYVRQGEGMYKVASLSQVWVLFDVYESELAWIKKGDKVKYSVASLPSREFEGTISFIDPFIDPKTRVAKARVVESNPNLLLKPEMFVSGEVKATLYTKKNTEEIVIPKTSVMWTGKRSVVYVRETSEKGIDFVMREVKLGLSLGESYIVEEGLKEGEEIAVNGTFSIDAAAQLAGKPSMMNGMETEEMNTHDHNATEKVENPVKKINIGKAAKNSLQPLYAAYFELKNALVKDDLKTAKSSSEKLKMALKNIDMSVFKGESHTLYMAYYSNINNQLEHFTHLENIEKARQKFQGISEAMVAMSKSFEPLENVIYVQFCPMADNNKGANWLSQEKNIKNPYFGKAMLTCGEVSLEIK